MRRRPWTDDELASLGRFVESNRALLDAADRLAAPAIAQDLDRLALSDGLPAGTPRGVIDVMTSTRPVALIEAFAEAHLGWMLTHGLAVDEDPAVAAYPGAHHQVLFPWDQAIRRYPPRDELLRLLQLRSPTGPVGKRDHATLHGSRILVAGSAGGPALADTLVGGGLVSNLTILDGSVVDGSGDDPHGLVQDVAGMARATLLARRLWRVNPYAEIDVVERPASASVVSGVLTTWPVAVAVDALSDATEREALRAAMSAAGKPMLTMGQQSGKLVLAVEVFTPGGERAPALAPWSSPLPAAAVDRAVSMLVNVLLGRVEEGFSVEVPP